MSLWFQPRILCQRGSAQAPTESDAPLNGPFDRFNTILRAAPMLREAGFRFVEENLR
jgi:hypothetical protein